MNRTLSFVLGGIAAGAVAGVAVGYWEARPWAANSASAAPNVAEATESSPAAPSAADPNGPLVPLAVVRETTFPFGNMESGDVQQHDFPVRNDGAGPLTVTYVSHTCKCTEVRMNGNPVEPGAAVVVRPGEEAKITLQWAAKVEPGPFRHGASFSTNDEKLDRIELTVEGEIVGSSTLEPSSLSFGTVRVGTPGRAELVMMSFIEPEVKILSHEVLDAELAKRVKIEVEPIAKDKLPNDKAKAGVRVIATYDPGDTVGPFAGSLKMTTNLEKSKDREVPIVGVVEGDVFVTGVRGWSKAAGLLRMPTISSAKGGSVQLHVMLRGDHAATTEVKVAEGGVKPPELKVTLGEREEIRPGVERIPLTIEIPAGTRPMVHASEDHGGEGEIVLETTHPLTTKVRIRVQFTVQP
jgi:hypothetical protein